MTNGKDEGKSLTQTTFRERKKKRCGNLLYSEHLYLTQRKPKGSKGYKHRR